MTQTLSDRAAAQIDSDLDATPAPEAQTELSVEAADTAHPAPLPANEHISQLGANLRWALDGSYAEQRAAGRAKLEAADLVRDPGMSLEEAREWTLATIKRLADRGIANRGFPVDGHPADTAASVVAFEMLAHGDLSLTIKSGVQFGLFGGAVTNLGTEYHHTEWLPKIVSLEIPGCFAMTEMGHGSDVQNLETTITWNRSTKDYEIDSPTPSATKTYIGNAGRDGRMAVVFGQLVVNGTNYGIHAILAPIRNEDGTPVDGVRLGDNGHKGGLLGVDNGTIAFDHVRVPREMLLNRFGGVNEEGVYESAIASSNARFFTMLGTLVRGRICVGASASLAARRAVSIATRYATQRRQFPAPGYPDGVTLMDYLSHQRRLLPAIARLYAFGFAHNDVTHMLVEVQEAAEHDVARARALEARAAGLKAAQTSFANALVQECREACGGAGYISENGITLLRQDVDIFATFEGDNTVLLQLVAKSLLNSYKEAWGNLDIRGTMEKTAGMVGRIVLERSTGQRIIDRLVEASKRRSGEAPVRDRGWHATMFREREEHILESLAQRMRAAGKSFDDFNALQDHMLNAAQAHIDRVVLDAFIVGVETCEDAQTKAVLNRLCDLYALSVLHDQRGWFQEHHRMSARRSKQLREAIDELCGKLRPDVLAIVEGLGIPEQWLNSAMLAPAEA